MGPSWKPDPTLTCLPRQLPPLRPPEGATGGWMCCILLLQGLVPLLAGCPALPGHSPSRRPAARHPAARAAGGALLSREAAPDREMTQDSHSPSAPSLSHQSLSLLHQQSYFPGAGRPSLWRFVVNCHGEGPWRRGGIKVGGAGPWLAAIDVKIRGSSPSACSPAPGMMPLVHGRRSAHTGFLSRFPLPSQPPDPLKCETPGGKKRPPGCRDATKKGKRLL